MSDGEGTVSRSFDVAKEIGVLRGQITTLQTNLHTLSNNTTQSIAAIDINPVSGMASVKDKKYVSFSGRSGEKIDQFLSKMIGLKQGSKWNDDQLAGNTVVALDG